MALTDFDLKADEFEWQCINFVEQILSLIGVEDNAPKFKRRTITNDTETINNISMMLSDGYVDTEWAVMNNPIIADEDQEELLKRLALTEHDEPNDDFPDGNEGITNE